jgi:formate/nitrite transporter FocA (FNT family)
MAGAELFTGNCLLSIPLLSGDVKLWRVIRNLVVVYIGNIIGSVFIAFLTTSSGVLELISTTVVDTAINKASLNPMQAFIRGLLCNMLITLGVWAAEASKGAPGKILSVYLPVVVFVLAGFENANTNMYFLSAGAFSSILHHRSADLDLIMRGFITNLVPVTFGNLIGGMGIGALYKHAHVEKEFDEE